MVITISTPFRTVSDTLSYALLSHDLYPVYTPFRRAFGTVTPLRWAMYLDFRNLRYTFYILVRSPPSWFSGCSARRSLEREYLSVGRINIPEIYLLSRGLGRPPFVLNYIVAPGWVTQMMSFFEMSKT